MSSPAAPQHKLTYSFSERLNSLSGCFSQDSFSPVPWPMYCLVLFNIAAYKVRQEGRMEPWADGDEGERQSSGCVGVVPHLRWSHGKEGLEWEKKGGWETMAEEETSQGLLRLKMLGLHFCFPEAFSTKFVLGRTNVSLNWSSSHFPQSFPAELIKIQAKVWAAKLCTNGGYFWEIKP